MTQKGQNLTKKVPQKSKFVKTCKKLPLWIPGDIYSSTPVLWKSWLFLVINGNYSLLYLQIGGI
jgi:hypothetical protein